MALGGETDLAAVNADNVAETKVCIVIKLGHPFCVVRTLETVHDTTVSGDLCCDNLGGGHIDAIDDIVTPPPLSIQSPRPKGRALASTKPLSLFRIVGASGRSIVRNRQSSRAHTRFTTNSTCKGRHSAHRFAQHFFRLAERESDQRFSGSRIAIEERRRNRRHADIFDQVLAK